MTPEIITLIYLKKASALSTNHANTNHCNFQNIAEGSNASLSHG